MSYYLPIAGGRIIGFIPFPRCSTMGVGCQSRRFNCLFWRETRQRILGHEISPYPEVVRGGEWELTTRPREKKLVAGPERRVGGWTGERQLVVGEEKEDLVVGQEQRELVAGEQKGSCGRRPRRAVETGQERGEQRGWRGSTEGQSTPDTGTERRGDKIGSSEEESQDVWFQ